LGDSRLATPCNVLKWAIPPYASNASVAVGTGIVYDTLPEFDYRDQVCRWDLGAPYALRIETASNAFAGNMGSSCFAMAIDLETSNGGEISGLNAEEQSDISLIARWNVAQPAGFAMDVYTYIDSMIVLRENNVKFILKLGSRANSIDVLIFRAYSINKLYALN